jgi:hypothetical protein
VLQVRDNAAVAAGYYAVAECLESLGRLEEAVLALETYMDLTRLADPMLHSRACCKFGVLYFRMGKFPQVGGHLTLFSSMGCFVALFAMPTSQISS